MYLLDTHIFLWWINDDPQLSSLARDIITNHQHTIFISSATIWEISIKAKLKRLQVPKNIDTQVPKNNFEPLAITLAHAAETRSLPLYHRDPFDRLLIAQAKIEHLTLLTHDKHLKKYGSSVRLV